MIQTQSGPTVQDTELAFPADKPTEERDSVFLSS